MAKKMSNSSTTSDNDLAMPLPESAFKINAYFPTLIFSLEIPGAKALNLHLTEAIYAKRQCDKTGIDRSNYSELGGWHSRNNLHKDASFGELVQYINAASAMISDRLGYHKSHHLTIGTMWTIINPPGSSNRTHIHPGCLWSGVYYIQAPKGSGRTEFIDPRTENLMRAPQYIPNTKRKRNCLTRVKITPEPGKMLIFPAWLYHGVEPNVSQGKGKEADRIIISFNLSQVKRK